MTPITRVVEFHYRKIRFILAIRGKYLSEKGLWAFPIAAIQGNQTYHTLA